MLLRLTTPTRESGDVSARVLPGPGVLGLFAGCTAAGGVQASGRLAWDALRGAEDVLGPAAQFCYGDRARGPGFHTDSKWRSVLAALGTRPRTGQVLVWHLQLLKLLPLFGLSHTRVVLFLHGTEAWRRLRWPERRLLQQVDTFLSNSAFTWQRFVEFNPEFAQAEHRTVPLGIGGPWPGSTPEPSSPPAALMVSRLLRSEAYKGHHEMLDAWPLVRQRIPDAQLWIAGEGDLRPDLERLVAERDLGSSVRFLGSVSEAHKEALIAHARCLAMPSRCEGFGLVYAEAMRLGRPCLVSTLDAAREVVDPTTAGLAVDPADTAAVADATCRLLAPGPEWSRWSQQARDHYEQHFTTTHFQQRFLAAFASPRVSPTLRKEALHP